VIVMAVRDWPERDEHYERHLDAASSGSDTDAQS
jgi:hypothetical protein